MEYNAITIRQLIIKRKQQGLCIRCGDSKADSYSTCIKCRSQFRSRQTKSTNRKQIKYIRSLKKWTLNKITLKAYNEL